jgi:hypothetical protein
MDRAGNTAATSATITITIQSVRTQKQNVLIQMQTAEQTASKHDYNMLRVASDALAASIDPSLWGAGNYLQQHGGVKVFEKEKQAVDKLTSIIGGVAVPTATLQGWIATLTNADRILASTQIGAAIAANGSASAIAQAQSFFAAGDSAVVGGNNSTGIQDYKQAWQQAMIAVGKPPDGGNDPGD